MGMIAGNTKISATTNRIAKIQFKKNSTDSSRSKQRTATVHIFPPGKPLSKISTGQVNWVKYVPRVSAEGTFRILLIDNEQFERRLICTSLAQQLNFAVDYLEAGSGEIALQAVGNDNVDLIIFVDNITDMNGLEFLDGLNKKCGTKKIPVIEMLNAGAASTGVQAMKMGAHDYLLKDSSGHHLQVLPILVSRIHTEHATFNALHHSASVQSMLADNSPSVIYKLSLQGGEHDVRINSQISEFGVTPDKWGNDTELHHQMCHEEDRSAVKKALEASYRTGSTFQCEYRIKTLGNSLRWFKDKAKVIMDQYGRPLFLHGVMTDITQFKSLETELAYYRTIRAIRIF